MEILRDNIVWILLFIAVGVIFLIKRVTKRPDAVTSKFEAEIKIEDPYNNILDKISQALKDAGFKKIGFNKEEDLFYAQSKISMSSWTEYIEVKIHASQNETELQFKSICALPTQVYDWGKNKRNWKKFEKELNKQLN